MNPIEVPAATRPALSILLVGWNTADWLAATLTNVVEYTSKPYEVIVVDNGSRDHTAEVLQAVTGATVVLNDDNVGFGPAVNQAALHAVAPYLCLLNPDVHLPEGWELPLLETLDADAEVGAVVPQLRNWDPDADDPLGGTLQEAGCIVGRDASTQSVGYGDDPDRPWYRFPRTVDYGSAACMVVRRSAFEAVGGFDAAFAPAYGEDVDLCFALDEAGWRTVYQPASVVGHVRGVTVGDDERDELLERHTRLLAERWEPRLRHRPSIVELPAYAHRSVAARDAVTSARVLVVADDVAAHEAALERLARSLPSARLTVAAAGGAADAIESLLAAGAEVVVPPIDWADFFERRWFQYDVVVEAGTAHGELRAQVARTQPQAEPVPLDGLERLEAAGVLPGGTLPRAV